MVVSMVSFFALNGKYTASNANKTRTRTEYNTTEKITLLNVKGTIVVFYECRENHFSALSWNCRHKFSDSLYRNKGGTVSGGTIADLKCEAVVYESVGRWSIELSMLPLEIVEYHLHEIT